MNLTEQREMVESSAVFKKWKKANIESFFYMVFTMFEKQGFAALEFSYYNPKTKIASVFGTENGVSLKAEDKVFGGKKPKELNLDDAKVGFGEALLAAAKAQQAHYSAETPGKNIVLLQVLGKKTVWNITYLTISFSTLNIKIDAKSGAVVEHSLKKLFDFMQ